MMECKKSLQFSCDEIHVERMGHMERTNGKVFFFSRSTGHVLKHAWFDYTSI